MPSRATLKSRALLVLVLIAGSGIGRVVAQGGDGSCPEPVRVAVTSKVDGKPIIGIGVRLGVRAQATDAQGVAAFDGVPAGTTRLVVAQGGFDRLEQELVLPPGKRTPIGIALSPERRVRLEGVVVAEDLDLPIAGARVKLVPITVPAAVTGNLEFTTDFDGIFVVPEFPAGTWRAEIQAAGCRTTSVELVASADGQKHRLALPRVFEAAALDVVVRDALGRPVPNAQVILAEAYPRGEVRRERSGADGRVRLADLKITQLNWPDAQNRFIATRRHVTLHAEAEGFIPMTTAVALSAHGTATLTLFADRQVDELEPNDTAATAQAIDVGATVKNTIGRVGDLDWFRFRLPESGRLTMKVGQDSGLATWFQLLDGTGRKLAERGSYPANPNGFDLPLRAGDYLLQIGQWGNNTAGERVMGFHFEYVAMPDPLSPNETPELARRVRPGEDIATYFLDGRDADCFRFVLPRPSVVRFRIPKEPFQRRLELRYGSGAPTGDQANVYADHPIVLQADLAAGEYVLVATEWGQDASPMLPASIRFEVIEDDGWNDTAAPGQLRPLEPDTLVTTSILPRKDVDVFTVALPSSGTLRVEGTSVHEQEIRVLDGRGRPLVDGRVYGGNLLVLDAAIQEPQSVRIELREWGSDFFSPLPYRLRTLWFPCEEAEAQSRNDLPEAATPFEAGDELRGTFAPIKDVDRWRFDADRPGRLELAVESPGNLELRVLDGARRELGHWNSYGGRFTAWASVPPGSNDVVVREWGDDAWVPGSYAITTRFVRADPGETIPLRDDPIRTLRLGEARPFRFEHLKDRDRFRIAVPAAGKYTLVTCGPLQREITGRDEANGQEVFRIRSYAGDQRHDFELKGPTRLLLEATEWGEDDCGVEDGLILVAPAGAPLVAERLIARVDRCTPTQLLFSRAAWAPHAAGVRASLDADGDGRADLELPPSGEVPFRYPAEGVYAATLVLEGAAGTRSLVTSWIDATGYRERKGIRLLVSAPRPGSTITDHDPIRASAISYSGARIARVEAAIDGQPVGLAATPPYLIDVPWDRFGKGEHRLVVTAEDTRGERARVESIFGVSEFLDLSPEDGAQIAGETVVIGWNGRSFGPAAVRLRKAGSPDWTTTVTGQDARARRLEVPDLEPGVAYEFQPVGDGEGPIRTVTRVKGLAFGKPRYAATLRRDYDQRVAVSVRNHGDLPAAVHLECGRPPEASRLLAGFVGDGSEGAPFTLAPGEERDFLLGVSAQDCVANKVLFDVRLVAEDGRAGDLAVVDLDIPLPKVALEWEDQGPLPNGLGRRLLLRNKGDTVTDLALRSPSRDLLVTPLLEHALFPSGQTLEVRATPRLFEGFRAVEAPVIASAVDRASEAPQRLALPEGQRIFAVDLAPRSEDARSAARERRAFLAGAHLDPGTVDWTKATQRDDTNGDGRTDRLVVDLPAESTRWIGLDHDGDGIVDAAHADIGADGIVDFAAMRGKDGFEETNVVETWLEMGFKLPWARSAYEKHDADILVNGTAVGKLRDTIPEGNYAFAVPPSALRFGEEGGAARNEVRIESKHLRGGHYVVSSDFRMKVKLTGTRVYAAGETVEAAKKSLLATEGLSLGEPDLSLSSHEMQVAFTGEAKSGAPIRVTAPLRNLGAGPARDVDVVLAFSGGQGDLELARTTLATVPAGATVPISLTATAPAGNVVLKLLVDPEHRQADPDRTNDEARSPLSVQGDATKPTLSVTTPTANARLDHPVVALAATASDDAAIARVEVRVDQGLWSPLGNAEGGFAAKSLLQPGAHSLTFRALDTSGNSSETAVPITVAAAAPTVTITTPAAGTKIDARTADVALQCAGEVAAVAVRANGGPWQPATLSGATATAKLPLPFGAVKLEAMGVSPLGVRSLASRPLECLKQPAANELAPATTRASLDVPGFGRIDPFGAPNPVAAAPDGGPRSPAVAADDPGPGGHYGSAPPFGQDPAPFEGLDLEEGLLEGPEGDDEFFDPFDWLDDPNVDRTEPDEFKVPDEIEDPDWQPPDFEAWDVMDLASEDETPESSPAASPGFAPLGAGDDGGRAVTIRQQQADWYCTNRPSVGVGFQLPEWLMKLKLPKPGTWEFDEAFKQRLEDLKALGFDTAKLEQMRQILHARCNRLESPEELPDFLQSLGFKKPTKQDPEALAEWREKMKNAADAFMLRLLHSDDPELIATGLRARLDALGKFDEASQDSAEAVIETIRANQRITEDVAALVPYLNIALAARGLATGESLGGEKLSTFQRALSALSLVGPAVKLLQNPTLRSLAAKLGNKAMWLGDATLGRLASKLGLPVDRLKGALKAMGDALGNARIRAGEKLFGKAWGANERFLNSPAGRQAAELAKQDLRQANALLTRIAQAQAAGDKVDYRRLIGLLQGNKTAQALLNSGKFSNQFRAALDRTHRAMGRLADKRTIAEVMTNPAVQDRVRRLARQFGVNAEDIVIKARNVSGNLKRLRDLKPGEMLKYGADRDVVYQFVTKQGRTLADVHHRFVEPVYARNIRSIAGRTLEEMDHVVTSRWHPEAYNAGLNPNTEAGQKAIADIISGRAAGRLGRPTDIRDTVIHKGREWMDAGDKLAAGGQQALGNQKVREGMRQMIKEYDRQVAQFIQAKGLDPTRVLPPRLRAGLDIFRRVRDGAQDGSFTVEQGREMLKALTPPGSPEITPQTIADALGTYVEFMNKWGLRRGG